jgi:hypothetical protein
VVVLYSKHPIPSPYNDPRGFPFPVLMPSSLLDVSFLIPSTYFPLMISFSCQDCTRRCKGNIPAKSQTLVVLDQPISDPQALNHTTDLEYMTRCDSFLL